MAEHKILKVEDAKLATMSSAMLAAQIDKLRVAMGLLEVPSMGKSGKDRLIRRYAKEYDAYLTFYTLERAKETEMATKPKPSGKGKAEASKNKAVQSAKPKAEEPKKPAVPEAGTSTPAQEPEGVTQRRALEVLFSITLPDEEDLITSVADGTMEDEAVAKEFADNIAALHPNDITSVLEKFPTDGQAVWDYLAKQPRDSEAVKALHPEDYEKVIAYFASARAGTLEKPVRKGKKAKAEKTPKQPKQPKEKKAKASNERDIYGYSLNSIKHLIAIAVESAGKAGITIKEIKELPWNTRKNNYKSYWIEMIANGFATLKEDRIFIKA